jgi:CheY-like chemotaxis protein
MSSIVKPAKLLLVDDKPANLIALEAVLGTSEYELVFAHSGKEALALLRQHHDIALILLDVQMPELDGYEVAGRIKAMPEFRDIPIVFITAVHNENPNVLKGYQAGAIDYISKPFDSSILKTKVGIYSSFRQKSELIKEKERQVAESKELLQASQRLANILESLRVGVMIADVDGKIWQVNKEGLRYWKSFEQGAENSHVESPDYWGHSGNLPPVIKGSIREALRSGLDSQNELGHYDAVDGAIKSIVVSASPLLDRSRSILGAIIVIQDVTPHKRVEDDIEKRIRHLMKPDA